MKQYKPYHTLCLVLVCPNLKC